MNTQSPLAIDLGPLALDNPVSVASGTFGYGIEYNGLLDWDRLGAVFLKGVTRRPKLGAPPPRILETPAGMLNAVGLENPGIEAFIKDKLPALEAARTRIIANILGNEEADYEALAERLGAHPRVDAIELNISCPNVRRGGIAFGRDPETAAAVVRAARRSTGKPLIAKLTPQAPDLVAVARACVDAGADSLSLVNTFAGMAIDVSRRRPILGNVTGGLSGPAIRPLALHCVYTVARALPGVPLVGMGGIATTNDALQFILAGATAISVGTAVFADPRIPLTILDGLETYCRTEGIASIADLRGRALGDSA